jgi:hypothetical protein
MAVVHKNKKECDWQRSDNPKAMAIHAQFQASNDQSAFFKAA